MEIDAVYSWNVFKAYLCGGPERKARCPYFIVINDWIQAGESPLRRFPLLGTGIQRKQNGLVC